MATTIPVTFTGTPSLDVDKVTAITQWYEGALGDSDKADDPNDAAFYDGQRYAYEAVLHLLHNDTTTTTTRESNGDQP